LNQFANLLLKVDLFNNTISKSSMKKIYLLLIIGVLLSSCQSNSKKQGIDSDGDGVYNNFDECPETPGLQEFNGCPDTDEDGVQDSEDDCPDDYGLEEFNGCPDTDEDGIIDSEDDCPDTYGYDKYNGCPNNQKMKLLASDCFKALSLTEKEIEEQEEFYQISKSSVINFKYCKLIQDHVYAIREINQTYLREVRELTNRRNRTQRLIDGGYIQTVVKPRFGQYLIVKKNNVFYLMNIVSGGDCTLGTMKFDENNFGLQDVWVQKSPNEERFKGFKMKIIDVSTDYDLLNSKIMKIGF
jgi:hypothetical protein